MRVLFLGDSVTAGHGLTVEDSPPVSHDSLSTAALPPQARLGYLGMIARQASGCELVASALDGVDTSYALKRFGRMVTAHDPDWVVVLLGLNDAWPCGGRAPTLPDAYADNLLGLVDRIVALGARPVLVAPNPQVQLGDDGVAHDLMPAYVAALRRVAQQLDYPWIDLHAAFLADGRLDALLPDGTHPSSEGHRLIADVFAHELPCLWPAYSAADFEPLDDAPIGVPSGSGRPATVKPDR